MVPSPLVVRPGVAATWAEAVVRAAVLVEAPHSSAEASVVPVVSVSVIRGSARPEGVETTAPTRGI